MRGVYSDLRETDKQKNRAGGRSQILLFAAYNAQGGGTDQQSQLYMQNEFRLFREANPGTKLFIGIKTLIYNFINYFLYRRASFIPLLWQQGTFPLLGV
jgi:hypothetical protein